MMYNEKSDSFLMQIEHPSDVSAHEYLFSVYIFSRLVQTIVDCRS